MTCMTKLLSDLKMEIKASVQAAHLELQRQQQKIANDMTLPGFRFHPTEEELVGYYLRRMVQGRRNSVELIASLDLYQYDPWELPAMAYMGEKEWFFFCPRDRKYPNGARPNRVTTSGYWKATGTDRTVRCTADFQCIGLKKTLVFYTGRAPRGKKTDWIMNEYRMPKLVDRSLNSLILGSSPVTLCNTTVSDYNYVTSAKNDVALCRIYRKSNSCATSAGSNQLHLVQSATKEAHLLGPRSTHQHLIANLEKSLQAIAPKHMITDCKQQVASETRAGRILQDYQRSPVPPAALTFCPSASSHGQSVLPSKASNLRSSHALMARLLEESCCYTGRSSQPIISLEYGDNGSHIGGPANRFFS